MMPVYLVGFMGCGKSTAGSIASVMLDHDFIDLDDYISQKNNISITEFFNNEGEIQFRKKEQEALRELSGNKNTIIATGGGCPCYADNIQWMNEHGITIYLKTHRGILYSRLVQNKKDRPLIAKLSDVELMEFIMNKLPEREICYRQAKCIIEMTNETPEQLALKIAGYIKSSSKKN